MEEAAPKKNFWKAHLHDGIVLISLVLVTAGGFIGKAIADRPTSAAGYKALILRKGETVTEIDLNALSEDVTVYTVEGVHTSLTIEAKKNAIRVASSGCPGQECVHEGWVTSSHPIICAYNKIYIDVIANSVDEEIHIG